MKKAGTPKNACREMLCANPVKDALHRYLDKPLTELTHRSTRKTDEPIK